MALDAIVVAFYYFIKPKEPIVEISRKDLYERVWSQPMLKLAKEFGVSDVGLSKACRRHGIPTPPPGHWTRVEHGKASPRPPLPPAPDGDTVTLSEERSTAQRLPADAPRPVAVTVTAATGDDALAPFAKSTLSALRKAKPVPTGLALAGGAAHFRCEVSRAQAERAARILDAIERKLPELGGRIARGTEGKPLTLDFSGQAVTFSLTERYTRSEFTATSQRNAMYPRTEYAFTPTGELKLAIEGYFDGRKSWSDGARARLEDKLPEVLAGLVAAANAMRRRRQEQEEQRLYWEEQERIRRAREEQERQRAQFREALATEAAGWQRHHAAAQYLAHLRQAFQVGAGTPQPTLDWLALAEQAVADLDPTPRRLQLLAAGQPPRSYEAPFGPKVVEDKRTMPGIYS